MVSSRLLLDTHVLVWSIATPHRIPQSTMNRLSDLETQMFVSAASAFEISLKARTGRMPDAVEIVRNYSSALIRIGAEQIDVTSEHALAAGSLEWNHGDPFDRLLVAQARELSLTLVTKDRAIRSWAAVETLWQ